jgi:hypothetical protein
MQTSKGSKEETSESLRGSSSIEREFENELWAKVE